MASVITDLHSAQPLKTAHRKIYEPRPDAPDHGRYVTKEAYWEEWYEGTGYEWNNGYLEAKPMSKPKQVDLYGWFLQLLLQFKKNFQSVQVMAFETGFSMEVPDLDAPPGQLKETTRKPDIGAILLTNPILWGEDHRSYHGTCDLCVEVISDSRPSEILRDTEVKFAEYEFAGVQEYYILDADNREMHFYARNQHGTYEEIAPDANGIIKSNVLHGLQFRRADLDTLPSLEELALDSVYQEYVLIEYQAAEHRAALAEHRAEEEKQRAEEEKQRAEEEKQRAEEEKQRAEEEKQRAEGEKQRAEAMETTIERMAAKLREIGIDPDELNAD